MGWLFRRQARTLLAGAVALSAAAASAAEMYRVTDLGLGFAPRAINDRGQIVGQLVEPGKSVTTAWLLDHGTATPITGPSEIEVSAEAINNHGLVVGWSQVDYSTTQAFAWDVQQGWRSLGSSTTSHAFAVNDNGAIAGYFDGAGVMSASGVVTPIDGLVSGWADGRAINSRGDVVGFSSLGDGVLHAFLWRDGVTRELNVAAHIPGGETSFECAYDVNVHGLAVGIAETPFENGDLLPAGYAFLATAEGPGGAASVTVLPDAGLLGVNDAGVAVGWMSANDKRDDAVAAIYRDGALWDLNDFLLDGGFCASGAIDVNNRGQIIAYGWREEMPEGGPGYYGLLLTPVPEPSNWALATAILMVSGGVARRRQAGAAGIVSLRVKLRRAARPCSFVRPLARFRSSR